MTVNPLLMTPILSILLLGSTGSMVSVAAQARLSHNRGGMMGAARPQGSIFATLQSNSAAPSPIPSTTTQPSVTAGPSVVPTDVNYAYAPTDNPTTLVPSLTAPPWESTPPSQDPTQNPSSSLVPSVHPSASLSPTATHLPSIEPSNSPSKGPTTSSIPSIAPSMNPSRLPSTSILPSQLPSALPTQPTGLPSESPTNVASREPSSYPSTQPSQSPSSDPTDLPSAFPSFAPTLECHDLAAYRSPINDLTCEEHKDTDCTSWRHVLGGNLTQLEDLVTSCPETCGIPCGAFMGMDDLSLSFIISRVPGLLDSSTQKPLEETALAYMTMFLKLNIASDQSFVLDRVGLKSQEPLQRRNLRHRALQQEESTLRVALSLFGFSIGVEESLLSDLLLKGVDSQGFTDELQMSSSFYIEAVATTAVREFPKAVDLAGDDGNPSTSNSATVVVISVLAAFAIAAIGVGFYVLQTRARQHEAEQSVNQGVQVPPESPSLSYQSSSLFSFSQQSPVTTPRAQQALYGLGAGQTKILGSLSRSKDSEDDPAFAEMLQLANPSIQLDAVVVEENHPLSGIIPPMIVFDEIDESVELAGGDTSPNLPSNTKYSGASPIVPSRRLKASQSLSKAMRSDQDTTTPAIADMMDAYSLNSPSIETDAENDKRDAHMHMLQQHRSTSFEDTADGDSDELQAVDSNSVASSPVDGSDMELGDHLMQRSASGSALSADNSAGSGFVRMIFPNSNAAFFTHNDVSPTQSNIGSSPRSDASPKAKTTPASVSASPTKGRTVMPQQALSATSDRAPPSGSRSTLQVETIETPPPHYRQTGSASRSDNVRQRVSRSANALQYTFEAPTNCKLGLTIESSRSGKGRGSTIHAVKEYSPLLGLIDTGDKILAVDSHNTSRMNSGEISKLLARRRGTKGNIRIRVARRGETSSVPTLPIVGKRQGQGNVVSVSEMTNVTFSPEKQEELKIFLNNDEDLITDIGKGQSSDKSRVIIAS